MVRLLHAPTLAVLVLSTIFYGCSSAYYNSLEMVGIHKREVMVDRVGEARDAQEEAKKQFQSAYEQFSSVVNVDGGELEEQYNLINNAFKKSKARAEEVHDRIESVESVAEALFDEWESELNQYSSTALRQDSKRKMQQTRKQYQQLIGAMKRAEDKIQPVLLVFQDQVLYLKHNLNARAIASLQGEMINLEQDVAKLVREMEVSIQEADKFIGQLKNN